MSAAASASRVVSSPALARPPLSRCARAPARAFTAFQKAAPASKAFFGHRAVLFPAVLGAFSLLSARSATAMASTTEPATFAAGCFWGVEHYINKKFKNGIVKSAVGYTGADAQNPKYQAVCSGATGHAEAVRFEYDPSKVNYSDLVEYFYCIHDPTTPNRQGNDVGTQYRSSIFYHDDEQKRVAEEVTAKLQKERFGGKKIATEIIPEQKWWDAEDYHQEYLTNNPGGYCNHYERW